MSFTAPGVMTQFVIKNDPFYPDIDSKHFADSSRTDGTISPERAQYVLIDAIQAVNRQLFTWRLAQQSAGFNTMSAVPAYQINSESHLVQLYRRAVYSEAKAQLFEHYRDYDTTPNSNIRIDLTLPQADAFRRDARNAISDIKGRTHLTCELI